MIQNVYWSSYEVPDILLGLESNKSRKNIPILNFMRLRPVGTDLLHGERHEEADSRGLQFCTITLKCMQHTSNGQPE